MQAGSRNSSIAAAGPGWKGSHGLQVRMHACLAHPTAVPHLEFGLQLALAHACNLLGRLAGVAGVELLQRCAALRLAEAVLEQVVRALRRVHRVARLRGCGRGACRLLARRQRHWHRQLRAAALQAAVAAD